MKTKSKYILLGVLPALLFSLVIPSFIEASVVYSNGFADFIKKPLVAFIIIEVILIFIIAGSSYLKRKKTQIEKEEESWKMVEKEIKAKKWFYIFLALLILSTLSIFLITYLCDEYKCQDYLFYIWIGINIFSSIGLLIFSLILLLKSWKDLSQLVSWQVYLSCLLSVLFWLSLFIAPLISFAMRVEYLILILFILGFGFSIGSLFRKGKLNRILAVLVFLMLLLFVFILLNMITF